MNIWKKLFLGASLALISSNLLAQKSPSLEKWDFSLGTHLSLSKAYGPALRYLREQSFNQNLFSNDIITYRNHISPGFGIEFLGKAKVFETFFVGIGADISRMVLSRTRRDQTNRFTPFNNFSLKQAHRLHYFSPSLEMGKQWAWVSLSGGIQMNVLLGGRSFRVQNAEPSDGTTNYKSGISISTDEQPFLSDPSFPDFLYVPLENHNFGFMPVTWSAFSEVRLEPFSKRNGPYFSLGYQVALNKYKRTNNPFWDFFAGDQDLSPQEFNLSSSWHSFRIGTGWVFL